VVCHDYFKKRFYLLEATVNNLAQGYNPDSILKVLKAMMETNKERGGRDYMKPPES